MYKIEIATEVFQANPSFRRGIVVAQLNNQGHSPTLEEKLTTALENASTNPIDLSQDDRILAWDKAHQNFGSNPNKFPPAHKNLLKRVQKPGTKLPFINKIVCIMNYNSIVSAMPVGGDDVHRAGNHLLLTYATGHERFTPLGNAPVEEHPEAGEIIYVVAETQEVMCRRWNWRNSMKTAISEETTLMVMNIDGLGEDSENRAIVTRDQIGRAHV